MTKVDNLSLKEKVLNYLKRGVAFISTAVIIFSASKDSAKAEGNSNLPNPTNIEEQTNAPIPSAGEDVITASETDINENEEITVNVLTEEKLEDLYNRNYDTYYNEKFKKRNYHEYLINAIYWSYFPNVTAELTNKLRSRKILLGEGDFDVRYFAYMMQYILEISDIKNREIVENAKREGRTITVQDLHNFAIDFELGEEMVTKVNEILQLWLDVQMNGIENNDSFIPLCSKIIGIDVSKDNLDALILKNTSGTYALKEDIYASIYNNPNGFNHFKIGVPFAGNLAVDVINYILDKFPKEKVDARYVPSQRKNGTIDYVNDLCTGFTPHIVREWTLNHYFPIFEFLRDFGYYVQTCIVEYTFTSGQEGYNDYVNGKYHESEDEGMVLLIDGDTVVEIPNAGKEKQKTIQ